MQAFQDLAKSVAINHIDMTRISSVTISKILVSSDNLHSVIDKFHEVYKVKQITIMEDSIVNQRNIYGRMELKFENTPYNLSLYINGFPVSVFTNNVRSVRKLSLFGVSRLLCTGGSVKYLVCDQNIFESMWGYHTIQQLASVKYIVRDVEDYFIDEKFIAKNQNKIKGIYVLGYELQDDDEELHDAFPHLLLKFQSSPELKAKENVKVKYLLYNKVDKHPYLECHPPDDLDIVFANDNLKVLKMHEPTNELIQRISEYYIEKLVICNCDGIVETPINITPLIVKESVRHIVVIENMDLIEFDIDAIRQNTLLETLKIVPNDHTDEIQEILLRNKDNNRRFKRTRQAQAQ